MFTRSFGSELAFYEVAATLIPLFLLAGVVFDRLKPKRRDSGDRISKMMLLIPVLGAWAILAEVVAVSVLVSANSNLLTRLTVASALSAGMVAVVASVWQPWFERYKMIQPSRAQAACRPTVALFLCAFVATVWIMEAAVSSQSSEESKNEILSEMNLNDSATFAVEDRIASLSVEAARASREFITGAKPSIGCLGLRAFLKEEEKIRWLMHREGEQLDRLMLNAINLKKRLHGEPPDGKLPFPPTPRFKPGLRVPIPYKPCIREEELKLAKSR